LDLGGTNFRVLLIELIGDELHHETQIFTIADEFAKWHWRCGKAAQQLFQYD